MRKSLTNILHLKRRDEISRLFKYGTKAQERAISIRCIKNKSLVLENYASVNRFIFVPQRNFGSSVNRNLVRRRLNEICRLNQNLLCKGFDIAIFVKKEVVLLSYNELEKILFNLFAKLGLLERKNTI